MRHFTRKGVAEWNTAQGAHRARTKHGNYNSWLARHGADYDYFASVDTDHVPLPQYLERMLGFFRDPDIAFVVGPQVYGNYTASVTKAAESQQYLFHALIQRAGNRYGAPMFVGTNNAVRISALRQVGGLYDSLTEDMATGFELHRSRNPATGRFWRSVYTPDVLAVGEGPSTWTDFFTQQLRWSRGTYETLLRQYWRGCFRMPPGRWATRSRPTSPPTPAGMVLGGGGVGEAKLATARTAVVDLKGALPGPLLDGQAAAGGHYPSSMLLPDDAVFATGGSADCRGRGASDIRKAQFYYRS